MKNFIKIPILVGFLMFTLLTRGQEYLPLLQDNKVWSIGHEKHTLIGDTIINETTYKKLFFHNFLAEFTPDSLEYIAALREDTINKKVFFIWKNHNEEVLLYDFSLNLGDVTIVNSPFYNFDGPHFQVSSYTFNMKVTEVKDTIVSGTERFVIKLVRYDGYPYVDYWIEGIGSTFGLIYTGFELLMDGAYPFLLCLHENNQLIYRENDPYGYFVDSCYVEPTTNIREEIGENFSINIYPSFIQDELNITSNFPLYEITVYNITGRIVYQFLVKDPFSPLCINTTQWQKGIYIIRAGNDKKVISKKLIKL